MHCAADHSCFCCACTGSELNGLTAVFQVSDSPAWLKAIVLKFALVARLAEVSSLGSSTQIPPLSAMAADDRASVPSDAAAQTASSGAGRPRREQSATVRATTAAAAAAETPPTGASHAPHHRKSVKRNHRQRLAARTQQAAAAEATEAESTVAVASPSSQDAMQRAAGKGPQVADLQQGAPAAVVTCATSGGEHCLTFHDHQRTRRNQKT